MSKDNNQREAAQNPYAAYGYNPQSYGQFGGYMDPNQFAAYGYPYQQQQQQPAMQVPAMPTQFPTGGTTNQVPGMLPLEESYIENILRLNRGKLATVYMGFDNTNEAKVFKGVVEAAGRDHIVLSDPQTGMRYLLLMVYLQYVTFDEEIEYDYPFGAGAGLVNYPPR
ncbi:spore coat protein GerQ [Bacillus sinesaloumensis]|uniref:spore coat protein GerQ n=1 Tax=Litchfieldia sinesaloumensis TaxID=1926280 RepID=UPI000988661A|nr:spore coat protein GerQ [Bacillus sinesaloumensis]